MENLFARLVGRPELVKEPVFTQVVAAVLDYDLELAVSLGEWLFDRCGKNANLRGTRCQVTAERAVGPGGRPDLILTYYTADGAAYASLVIENKLSAGIGNPVASYISEVETRRQEQQICEFVLISHRYARDDAEIAPFVGAGRAHYVNWFEVDDFLRKWLRTRTSDTHVLALNLVGFMEGLGMDFEGGFGQDEIATAAHGCPLIAKLHRVLQLPELDIALKHASLKTRADRREWWDGGTVAKFCYLPTDAKQSYVAMGFAFVRTPDWQEPFGSTTGEMVAFVGIGTDEWRDDDVQTLLASWLQKRTGTLDPKLWNRPVRTRGTPLLLYTFRDLASFPEDDSGVKRCADYLADRLRELRSALRSTP